MKLLRTFLLAILALTAVSVPARPVHAPEHTDDDDGERILSFQSEIAVHEDASMTVRETIKVHANGDQIKHGIYRDFPTIYKARWGLTKNVDFEVTEVLRDGRPEDYHSESLQNGIRIYIGKRDFELPEGIYTYTLSYQTNRQLGFFASHDELYWNVTGNGWIFPIEKVDAVVTLPSGISRRSITLDGYTGPQGAKNKDFEGVVEGEGRAHFQTTAPLAPYEGFTLVVEWPKGFVRAPTQSDIIRDFLRDNRMIVFGAFGLLVLIFYYVVVWFLVGRDPAEGTIIPLFGPPDDLAPGAVRYLWKMGYDDKVLAASLINLGVKKEVKIEEKDGAYTLVRQDGGQAILAPEERKLLNSLLGSRRQLEIKRAHRGEIVAAVSELKTALKLKLEKNYFITNRKFFIPGALLTAFILFVSLLAGDLRAIGTGFFMSLWLSGWSVGVFFLLRQTRDAWKVVFFGHGLLERGFGIFGALFTTAFAVPFVAGEIFGLFLFAQGTSVWMLGVLVIAIFLNLLFYTLLKAPTLGGRKALDKIEGLRMYLGVAEKDRLNAMNPPKKTPELFEQFLPYALALDVDQKWSEQFSDVLTAEGKPVSESYSPSWYAGTSGLTGAAFAGALGGSLAVAVASASTSPSSSSGGGGGGSSGGGGGGGGGGGW